MRITERRWAATDVSTTYTVRVLSDIHLGVRACDEALLQRAVDEIRRTPHMYWVGLGDVCDFVGRSDKKRFRASALAPWIGVADIDDIAAAQVRKAVEVLGPIADKCLLFLMGNHEEAIAKYQDNDVYGAMRRGLEAQGMAEGVATGYAGMLRLVWDFNSRVNTLNVLGHHGYGGGALLGGKALRLARYMADNPDADVVLMGHVHSALHTIQTVNRITRLGTLAQRNRHGVICGTFLRATVEGHGPTYGEVAQYPPSPVAYPDILIKPFRDNSPPAVRVVLHSSGG
jgi:predicted phosphodiesterase